jgi:hypothetical protein
MDKENISSTYSPSVYKRAYGLSDVSNTSRGSGGFMGMLLSAKDEVHKETNNQMAEVVAKRMHRQEIARAKEIEDRERQDREAAERFQMEEKDAYHAEQLRLKEEEEFRRAKELREKLENDSFAYAQKIQESEEKEAEEMKKQLQRQHAKDAKLAKKMQVKDDKEHRREILRKENEERKQLALRRKKEKQGEIMARKILLEEERALKNERARKEKIAKQDMELAKRMQDEELAEVHENADRIVQKWKEPTVEVEEREDGVLLVVELSGVRRMEVDLDEDAKIIFVNAIAKSKVYDPLRDHHDEIRKLATKNKVEGSEFQIDLNSIVDGVFSHEDIDSKYDPKTGELEVFVHDVTLSSKQKRSKFLSSMSTRLSKLFGKKKNRNKNSEASNDEITRMATIKRRYSKK